MYRSWQAIEISVAAEAATPSIIECTGVSSLKFVSNTESW